MKCINFNSLNQEVTITMSMDELAALYSSTVDSFCKMNEQSPLWKKTETLSNDFSEILKLVNKLSKTQ